MVLGALEPLPLLASCPIPSLPLSRSYAALGKLRTPCLIFPFPGGNVNNGGESVKAHLPTAQGALFTCHTWALLPFQDFLPMGSTCLTCLEETPPTPCNLLAGVPAPERQTPWLPAGLDTGAWHGPPAPGCRRWPRLPSCFSLSRAMDGTLKHTESKKPRTKDLTLYDFNCMKRLD